VHRLFSSSYFLLILSPPTEGTEENAKEERKGNVLSYSIHLSCSCAGNKGKGTEKRGKKKKWNLRRLSFPSPPLHRRKRKKKAREGEGVDIVSITSRFFTLFKEEGKKGKKRKKKGRRPPSTSLTFSRGNEGKKRKDFVEKKKEKGKEKALTINSASGPEKEETGRGGGVLLHILSVPPSPQERIREKGDRNRFGRGFSPSFFPSFFSR